MFISGMRRSVSSYSTRWWSCWFWRLTLLVIRCSWDLLSTVDTLACIRFDCLPLLDEKLLVTVVDDVDAAEDDADSDEDDARTVNVNWVWCIVALRRSSRCCRARLLFDGAEALRSATAIGCRHNGHELWFFSQLPMQRGWNLCCKRKKEGKFIIAVACTSQPRYLFALLLTLHGNSFNSSSGWNSSKHTLQFNLRCICSLFILRTGNDLIFSADRPRDDGVELLWLMSRLFSDVRTRPSSVFSVVLKLTENDVDPLMRTLLRVFDILLNSVLLTTCSSELKTDVLSNKTSHCGALLLIVQTRAYWRQ